MVAHPTVSSPGGDRSPAAGTRWSQPSVVVVYLTLQDTVAARGIKDGTGGEAWHLLRTVTIKKIDAW
jgi:hypothetical protein